MQVFWILAIGTLINLGCAFVSISTGKLWLGAVMIFASAVTALMALKSKHSPL